MADTNVMEYKCPCCGGAVTFDSTAQQMKCPFCESTFDVEALKHYDDVLSNEQDGKEEYSWGTYDENSGNGDWREGETDGMFSYVCQSCGGEIVGDSVLAATMCPYCGNAVVLQKQFSGMLRPDYVIPFKLDKNQAKERFKKHLSKKPLLPKRFKSDSTLESIMGIYVPFWLFNCDTDGSIRYKATRVRVWSDSSYNYTETSYYSLMREGSMGFERVPIDGSTKMDDAYMEAIEPYDYADMVDFQTAYLAGYLADKYDVDSNDGIPRINERIKNSTIEAFAATAHGYTTCVAENTNISVKQGDIKYALMPVWTMNANYGGKLYSFVMNGQTGKLVGKLPVDMGRFWLFTLMFTGIFGAVSTLFLMLVW